MAFTPGQPEILTDEEFEAVRGDIGRSLILVEPNERGIPIPFTPEETEAYLAGDPRALAAAKKAIAKRRAAAKKKADETAGAGEGLDDDPILDESEDEPDPEDADLDE
jgi:hypothetical protein